MNKSIYRQIIFIRQFEQLLLKLFSEGKLNGTVHTCVGQELVPALLCNHITESDTFFSNHRGHGHYLSKTHDYKGLLAEVIGLTTGCSKGYGGSQHLHFKGFYSNGIQGGFAPVAVGKALSEKIRNPEEKNISVIFIGDGTLGEGTLYEAFNLAAIYNAPILFVLENNRYAQSTSSKQTTRGSLRARIEGFGLSYYSGSIYDAEALNATYATCVENVRSNKPSFIEVDCYRLNSHSKGDDNREPEEVSHHEGLDPINLYKKTNPKEYEELSAEASSFLENLLKEISADERLTNPGRYEILHNTPVSYAALPVQDSGVRVNENIYDSLKENMERDKRIMLIGEDIENNNEYNPRQYGGAFKVTRDLSNLFPENVKNTPISEAGIAGLGIGLALGGMKSVVEIMFGDFSTLVVDQVIQQASKIQGMYGVKLDLPFVLRTPMGGKRGYGPTHSQSLERLFMGVPYLNLIALNTRVEPKSIYNTVLTKNTDATIIIENKIDYAKFLNEKFVETHTYEVSSEMYPTLKISPREADPQFTIFCYGGNLGDCEKAAYELYIQHEIFAEIICPALLQPFNLFSLMQSVKTSKKLLIVEEGPNFAALGSEVVAALIANKVTINSLKRIGNHSIIPSSFQAELALLPNSDSIKNQILESL